MIKKIFVFVLLIIETVVILCAQNQLNNSGFELWEGTGDALHPIGWNTMNTADGTYAWAADKGQVEPSSDIRKNSRGKKSIRIYARSILGVIANGNITTGRVHTGSMRAASMDNNNCTRTREKGFHHAFSGKPDSLTVWVKSDCIDPTQNSYIHALIHDEFDYCEPPTEECKEHLVAEALIYFTRGQWKRASVAFRYSSSQKQPEYILVAVGTNQIAGKGDKKDAVFLDDFLMIYNPSISLCPLSKTAFLRQETIEISFILKGTMSPENLDAPKNVVSAELSDKNGSFDHPSVLGSITTDKSGMIKGIIPSSAASGSKYRIRLVTTNYPMVSKDNGVNISIN